MSDNAIKLVPGTGHVESHFLKAVSPDGRRALWIKHTLLSPKDVSDVGIAEVWAIAFDRDRGPLAYAKRVHPLRDAEWSDAPFSYDIGDAHLGPASSSGRAESSGHRITWSFEISAQADGFRPFPRTAMYEGPFPRQKALTPVPSALMTGEAEIDGTRWALEGWRGMQGHNWGEGHSERYAWVHCNALTDQGPETWVEVLTGRVRVAGLLLPWLSVGGLSIDGHVFRFDGLASLTSRALSVERTHYRTTLEKGDLRLDLDVETTPESMAGLHYENPDGSMTYCLNSKLATGSVSLSGPGRETQTFVSDAFALEIGTKDPDHGIRMLI